MNYRIPHPVLCRIRDLPTPGPRMTVARLALLVHSSVTPVQRALSGATPSRQLRLQLIDYMTRRWPGQAPVIFRELGWTEAEQFPKCTPPSPA